MRRRPCRPLSELQIDKIHRVLLINSTALGDLLFSTPAIRCLKRNFPSWELDIVVQPGLRSLLQHNPDLNRCWMFPGRNLRLLELAKKLRISNYDLTIILHGNDPEASLLAWLTASPFIIGSSKSPCSFAYSYGVASGNLHEHAIEKRLNFVRPLEVTIDSKQMEIFLPAFVRKEAEKILTQHFGNFPAMLIAFHPGGSAPYKQWPPDHFVTLGKFLKQVYNAHFLLISTTAERDLAQSLADRIKAPALVTGGEYDLLTVAALLSRCRLFVGNDSGPLHLAMALQTPGIGLLGADDPKRIGPYEADWGSFIFKEEACLRNPCLTKQCRHSKCLEAIRPEDVIRLIQDWWQPKFLPH
jgi:ADP-heptose:LPS heptosyltransferase